MNVYVYRVGWDQKRRGATNKMWALGLKEYTALVTAVCFYCGREPSTQPSSRILRSMGIKRNGIDRTDSTKGYETGNCVTACGECNREKGTLTLAEFVEATRRRYEHLKKNGLIQESNNDVAVEAILDHAS